MLRLSFPLEGPTSNPNLSDYRKVSGIKIIMRVITAIGFIKPQLFEKLTTKDYLL
jgi:hypothetical protein